MLKRIMRECIPTIIALTFTGLYSVIDGLFIGNAAGDTGLAAVNLAWPIPAFVTAVGLGVGTGGSILYSNANGRGDREDGYKIFKTTICWLLVCAGIVTGILFAGYREILCALGARQEVYFQAEAYSRIIILGSIFQISGAGMVPLLRNLSMQLQAMCAMGCGMLTNLLLNYLLIVRLGIGIRGAALGTVCAQMIVCTICVYEFWGGESRLSEKAKVWNRCEVWKTILRIKRITKTGFPAFGMSLAPTVILMFTNWQCLKYGGKQAVAAYAVISYIVFPIQSLLQGVGDGLQPLMSYYAGAGKKKLLQKVIRYAYGMIAGIGCLAFLWAVGSQGYIGQWFHLSKEAGKIFREGFAISAVSFLFYGFVRFHVAYMSSKLKIKLANGLIYGECLVVAPALLVGLPEVIGIYGIWWTLPLISVCMTLIYIGIQAVTKMKYIVEKTGH